VIEGLALQHIAPGEYEMRCLPLKIVDSDGAPARVLLRPL
jgi:arylformamidase